MSDPPRMHELAPCSLHVRVCAIAIYLFTLTIPYTCEGETAAEVPRGAGWRRRRLRREEERATSVTRMGVGHLETFHLPGYVVGTS